MKSQAETTCMIPWALRRVQDTTLLRSFFISQRTLQILSLIACPHTDLVLVVQVGLTGEELLHHLTVTMVGSNPQRCEATLHIGNRIITCNVAQNIRIKASKLITQIHTQLRLPCRFSVSKVIQVTCHHQLTLYLYSIPFLYLCLQVNISMVLQ